MKRALIYLPYALVLAAVYYLPPLFVRDTGGAMVLYLCAEPAAALVCGAAFGVKRGFDVWLPVIAAVLFIPAVFVYMNSSALPYAAVYGVADLMGVAAGRVFYGKK